MTRELLYPQSDRAAAYRAWHRSLGGNLYVCDLDQIEYDGTGRPVAFIELTRTNCDFADLDGIWERLNPDGNGSSKLQMVMLRRLGAQLRIPAFVTVFNEECDQFAVRRLVPPSEWKMLSADRYEMFLYRLRKR